MKTLIENSIEIYGMGHPDVKHVFNIDSDEERKDRLFRNLEKIKNRRITIRYKYNDDNNIISDGKLLMIIPDGDELVIKEFITSTIIARLNTTTSRRKRR